MTRTIVFHHPVPGSGFVPWPPSDDGIVVVCPDRPGYGRRPVRPDASTPTVAGTAEMLLDRLARDGIVHIDLVVGWSGGGHYALAMAAIAPERVDAAALVATPAHDDDVAWIPDHLRPDVEAWRRSPERAVDLVVAQFDGITGRRSMLCAGSDDHQLLVTDPQLCATIDRMLASAFRHGPTGMARDIVAQHVNDWGFDPASVQQPVQLFYASGDPIVPAEHGDHWATTLAHSSLTITPSSGHLTPLHQAWQHLDPDTPRPGRRRRRRRRRWSPSPTADPFASHTGTDLTSEAAPASIRHRPSWTETC